VGDGLTIIYIQDILVLKAYKRKGIGKKLMNRVLERFVSVRQKVLLTDDNEETRGFYESLGFESCDKGQLVSFVKLENK
jgi:ribosomal protein S18 acetylase RimI-like enzyme